MSAVSSDPRPVVAADGVLQGARCVRCAHALVRTMPRCPRCRGLTAPARFGPDGTVWACTVVHVPAFEGQVVPYALAYVDLDGGPRLLAQLAEPGRVGARARITGRSPAGDPVAEVVS